MHFINIQISWVIIDICNSFANSNFEQTSKVNKKSRYDKEDGWTKVLIF